MWPARSASVIPWSSDSGIGNCLDEKSPTVRSQICAPPAFSLRTRAASARIAEALSEPRMGVTASSAAAAPSSGMYERTLMLMPPA